MITILLIFGWVALVVVGVVIALRMRQTDRSRRRLFYTPATTQDAAPAAVIFSDEPTGIARWLFLAGYRSPTATRNFMFKIAALGLIGLLITYMVQASGSIDNLMLMIGANRGGALDILALPLMLAPWGFFVILTSLPILAVRSARRKRVQSIEQDLPLTLEILATLVETGLSFDPALARVLESQPPERPLTQELQNFRDENRAGRPRIESFRRMARRVDVLPLSTFVSAIVQAEQVGGGIGTVLTEQSTDLRKRRRERALEAATALPVKQLVPLFICFLPGIFVWSLGPTMYKLIGFFDNFVKNGGIK